MFLCKEFEARDKSTNFKEFVVRRICTFHIEIASNPMNDFEAAL